METAIIVFNLFYLKNKYLDILYFETNYFVIVR